MKHYFYRLPNQPARTLGEELSKHFGWDLLFSEKLVRQGSVYQDKIRLKNPDKRYPGVEIEIYYPDKPIDEFTLNPRNIAYEDDHILIVNKDCGVNTCPSPFSDIDCLSWGVQKYLRDGGSDYPVSVIHRLDKPAQGLVFFAKSKTSEIALHRMFMKRQVKKLYLAVTPFFKVEKEYFTVRDELDWRGKIQTAKSYIRYLGSRDGCCYFTVYPLTGRPHQIRKHFASYLQPIIGDAQYGPYAATDELLLYCFYYRFNHPITGKRMEVKYLPDQLKSCIEEPNSSVRATLQ